MCGESESLVARAIVKEESKEEGGVQRVMARLQTPTRYYANHLLHETPRANNVE